MGAWSESVSCVGLLAGQEKDTMKLQAVRQWLVVINVESGSYLDCTAYAAACA